MPQPVLPATKTRLSQGFLRRKTDLLLFLESLPKRVTKVDDSKHTAQWDPPFDDVYASWGVRGYNSYATCLEFSFSDLDDDKQA